MMGRAELYPWTTGNEIRFVQTLGAHTKRREPVTILERLDLLDRYYLATFDRVRWGTMDVEAVRDAVGEEVSRLRSLIDQGVITEALPDAVDDEGVEGV